MARVITPQLGGVGISRIICDNCKGPVPIAWRDGLGREFCSNRCRTEFEAKSQEGYTKENTKMVEEGTAAATAPAKKKTVSKGKAKTAAKKKTAAKGKAKAKASTGTRSRYAADAVITRTDKENPYRGKRAEIVKLMKSGMTVEKFAEKFKEAGFSSPGPHLARAVEEKLITVK